MSSVTSNPCCAERRRPRLRVGDAALEAVALVGVHVDADAEGASDAARRSGIP